MLLLERRSKPRESIALKLVANGNAVARTRDVAPDGLYLEVPPGFAIDQWMHIELEFRAMGLLLRAVGEVMRIEREAMHVGVALRLHSTQLVPLR